MPKTELLFLVEDDPEGGFTAHALQESIFVQGESMDEIRQAIREAVACHYEIESDRPPVLRIHYVHDEILAS